MVWACDEKEETKAVRVVIKMNIGENRGSGRPKKRRMETVENYMRVVCM